jgi:cephalosporin-C deacetylase-like acetyl esterase
VDTLFTSTGGVEIAGHLARPRIAPGTFVPGLVIAHGYPHLKDGARLSGRA